jgi:hypothetical protein
MTEILFDNCKKYAPSILLGIAALVLFLTSPIAGDFSWSDAPRHALNGVFIRDIIAHWPVSYARQYAINYYIQFPALTLLFYPPLLPVIMAGFYALFGVSHAVAQACVSFFCYIMAIGAYLVARRWLPKWQAFSASLLLIGTPEVAYWGRQVMLDIPTYAWLILSTLFFLRYLDNGKGRELYLATLLLICALYTKQTVIYMIAVYAFTILMVQGSDVLRKRHIWYTFALMAVFLSGLVYLTLKFGQVNVASVEGAREGDLGRTNFSAWLYYFKQMPRQLGWPTFTLGLSFILGVMWRPEWRMSKADGSFLLGWLVAGYLFFSAIAVREPRHDLTILFPMVVFAVIALNRFLGRFAPKIATIAALVLACGTFAYTLVFRPVPFVTGYAEAAHIVTSLAPKNSVVLFSGNRDGTFIFNMRADANSKHLSILRADKILLRLAIERERGCKDLQFTEAQIAEKLNRYAVHYVVAENDFWTDLPSIKRLQNLLHDRSRFEIVRRIKVRTNENIQQGDLLIYRNLGEVAKKPEAISLEMVGIGQTFHGVFGGAF